MDKRLQNKLKAYSSLTATAALVASSVDAQVVHTTLNYTGGYERYDIDIDGDGNFDTAMWAGSYAPDTYDSPYSYYSRYCGLYGPANKVLNSYYRLVNLASGVLIDASQSYFDAGYFKQMVGTISYVNYPSFNYTFGDPNFVGAGDKFVGVRFDISGNTHYGWLRFTNISVDASSWTLVDMAYESTPDQGILTGDTGPLALKESKAKIGISATENSLEISSDASLMNASVEVVNMLGQTVATATISSNTTSIAKTFGSGIYIVTIIDEKGKAITRKVRV
jgi:hypothetical protein